MTRYDNRTVSDEQHSYYVFDDLRFQQNAVRQNRGSADIFYYDTLEEALTKLHEIPEDMTPALGMHRSSMSELDLIHRRNGEYVLVSDYQNFSRWRTDPVVNATVNKLCTQLQVDWRMDSKCFRGTVLVPLERGFHRIPDKGTLDKCLHPKSPKYLQNTADPSTAVNEVFSPQQGWIPYAAAVKASEAFGFHDPNLLKIQQFNITYVDSHGKIGQRDVSPLEMNLLMERWKFQHGDPQLKADIAKRAADELDDFLFSAHITEHTQGAPDKAAAVSRISSDILSENTTDIIRLLQDIRDDGHQSDAMIAQAHLHLARLEGFHNNMRRPSLTDIIHGADDRVSAAAQDSPSPEPVR